MTSCLVYLKARSYLLSNVDEVPNAERFFCFLFSIGLPLLMKGEREDRARESEISGHQIPTTRPATVLACRG